jgi:glycosyltransferase involved in cell wall biosynthesis
MDFVRAQDPYFCGLIGYLVARGTRRPFCISVHADYDKMHELDKRGGAPRIFGSRALARRLESWLLAHADRVLVITDYIARYAESRGAARDRIRLFRHVIDTATFEQVGSSGRATAGGTEDRPVISVVSRLSAQKYIDDVVDIALALRKRGVDFEIRVAGDGDERDRLERAIDRAALRDSVVLLGFQDQAALGRLHEVSVLHLSLICGASLIEACTAGICVIGYDVEWQSELIRTGETGVLVPAHDCEAAANAIEQLLRAPEERRRLGAAARAAARSMFDPQTLRGVRRGVYRDLVEGRAA